MKNQYFGDKRDYFKYDLIIDLASCLQIPCFTNIVMLTRSDESDDGKFTRYKPGKRNRNLYEFLRANTKKQCRKVSRLRDFFDTKEYRLKYVPYGDNSYFEGRERTSYFAGIPQEILQDAVVLVDPDTGLTPPNGGLNSDKHVLPCEVLGLKEAMGSSSVLVVFQFADRTPGWRDRFNHAKNHLGSFDAIHNKSLSFLCITKDTALRAKLQACLRRHATDHGLEVCSA